MNNLMRTLVYLFLLIFSNFTFAMDQIEKDELAALEKIDKFVWEAPIFIKDYSLAAIRKLGKMLKEETKKSPNLHDQTKINLEKTFYFDGLKITGLIVVDKPADEEKDSDVVLLTSITITSPQWKILHGLEVGGAAEKLLQVLGKPSGEAKDIIKYSGTTEEIQFFTKKNKIEKIIFTYYLD